MSMWLFVLGLVGLALGAIVLLTVLALLERVHRPLREIERYADDVLAAGLGIARNLDAVDEAARTRELAAALPGALRKAIG
ncbi:MAG: hypothetical protein E6G08_19170 [Actinobacteria bacterium]|nr:MAG: hypothetical protein E6G08_19170 [Actinomycetota bacterium]